MGTAAWTAFAITDVIAAHVHQVDLEYLGALRLAGTGVGFGAYALCRIPLSEAVLDAIEIVLSPVAAFLVALAAIKCGGITSPLAHGVGIITLVRAVLPSPWTRALPSSIASAAMFPLAVAVGSRFDPALEAQIASPAMSTFIQISVFLVLGSIVAAAGSHLQWNARQQVQQARRLGAYRLVARIGSGGMGEVWLARQLPLDRRVALKILKESTTDDPNALRRFRREAEAASRLSHPNTIRLYDFGASDDGVFYIAMEMLDGMDVEALIERTGPLPPERVLHFARQACASLAEAHHRGVVHCDLKPANLFVTKVADDYDFIKVLDFGLARLTVGHGHTTVDSIRGTPAFMPPEVVRGEPAGPESDVYAMGACLYYMLTATPVFRARGFHEQVTAQLEGKVEPPSMRLGEELPQDLEAIVMRCLSKSRGERYVTARELEQALAKCRLADAWSTARARAAWEDIRPSLGTMVTRPG